MQGRGSSSPRGHWVLHSSVGALVTLHVLLLAWSALRHSPGWDEPGHLVAGMSHWRFGTFDLYRVNPPLVRTVAVVPAVVAGPAYDWSAYDGRPGARPEGPVRMDFIRVNGARIFWFHTLARWACIPFSLIGAYVCWRWGAELYGPAAGVTALALWCFSPSIVGHGALITPDVGSAALGAAAAYLLWKWLEEPTWYRAIWAGIVFGLAQLTKFTLLVFFGLWPLLWIAWRLAGQHRAGENEEDVRRLGEPLTLTPDPLPAWDRRVRGSGWRLEAAQIAVMLLLGLYVINVGYGFEGTFTRLGEYGFVTEMFGGPGPAGGRAGPHSVRNRFKGTLLAPLPVPVPKNYLMGIDLQRADFEGKMHSYLRGEWRMGGWWYYYLYALFIKEPLGTWMLAFLAAGAACSGHRYTARLRSELVLLAPLLAVLVLVSSQTGFSHHLRYVLPIFPFGFIWISKAARAFEFRHRWMAAAVAGALTWSVVSSLWVYPHSLSYFNELVGGPRNGHYHLGNSNADWGQDLFYLKRWLDRNPQARPLTLASYSLIDPRLAGIDYVARPPTDGPEPGWHAVSVNRIHHREGQYEYFLRMEPVAMAGYSIYIYHITLEEANPVRRELGLPELDEAD